MKKKLWTLVLTCVIVFPIVFTSFHSSVHADTDSKTKKANSNDQKAVDITNKKLKEGDLDIIEGDGDMTYNDDGSATFNATGNGKNKVVYKDMDKIKNGSFEADITANADLNRFGFIYRVQGTKTYKYTGTGDKNNQYFSEVFGSQNKWTQMSKGKALKADKTYHLQAKFNDDKVTLFIDDKKMGSWSQSEGTDKSGKLGLEKSRGAAKITMKNIRIKEKQSSKPPERDPVEAQIHSDYMDVKIDENFPRVMEYDVDDKVMQGQQKPVYGLKINGDLYYPDVSFEKASDDEAIYTMTVKDEGEDLDATFKVSMKADDNKLIYRFTDIKNNGDAVIESIDLNHMNFISADAKQKNAEATLTNITQDVTKPGDKYVKIDDSLKDMDSSNNYYTAFLSADGLSAGVWSSSEVDGYGNLIASRFKNEDGEKSLGIGSNALYYQRDFMSKPSSNQPTVKVAIAKDLNHDDQVDWQDGAIAYRDIMQDIKGYEDVNNNVGMRIAMNFGSQAQQPFLKTLDNVKKTALATDDLGQAVLLKGYANEGHDSAHPDYGDVGERMGGVDDLNTLISEGHKYNTDFGVHINAQETYPEAKAFNDDFIVGPDSLGWGWLDQSYEIDKKKDLASGSRAKRLDQLHDRVPGLDFIYLDVWHQDQWESDRIAEQFMDRGWRVSSEFGNAIANYSTWQHWATDKNYGGADSKGINSDVLRFISNHQKDSWVLNMPDGGGMADHPLLGGYELAGFEGWQSDKNYDHFLRKTFDANLPTKFLQKYYVTNWEKTDGDPTKTNLEKKITLQDPSNDDEVVVKRKKDSRERTITLNDHKILDGHKYLIPWVEQDFKHKTPKAKKLYHWNKDGGESTWTLPDGFTKQSHVTVYKLTDQGRKDKQEVDVTDNKVTLNADASTPYIVVNQDDKGVKVNDWGTDAHVYDPGFNTGEITDDFTTVNGDTEATQVKRTNQKKDDRNLSSGDYYLQLDGPKKDTTVTRELTDLQPGKDYVAEVYVDNQSDEKATIDVTGGKEKAQNYTLKSLQKNYVKADSHATNDGSKSKMQRMQVSFTAEKETAKLHLGRQAGKGKTKFDDIRIVQKSLDNHKSANVFKQDFESVTDGIYPFVVGNSEGVVDNRIHLSEKHAPYTQKGWADKKQVDDVLDGDWSLKVNAGNSGLAYRTIPQNYHFESGKTYKVSFDYQTTSDSYRFISGDKAIDVDNIDKANGLDVNKKLAATTDTKTAEFTVTGSDNGQTYIGVFNDGTDVNMDTGEGTFMLDNLKIEASESKPELKVKDESIKAGDDLDLKSMIKTAKDPNGKDITNDVSIDKGNFDPKTPGKYDITFTISVDGYDDVTKKATVRVDAAKVADLKSVVERYDASGDFTDKKSPHKLKLHLTAVERFESQKKDDKVNKHLKRFNVLLDQQQKQETISKKAYQDLTTYTDQLLKKLK